jgi:MarR family transcriptional regulator, organic hydroperoxide resistance regulator
LTKQNKWCTLDIDMDVTPAAHALIRAYPLIYFACHRRHVRDPKSGDTLSATAASVLDHLDAVEPVSVSNLAKHMGVTASTMSLSLARLEDRGYVRRARDLADARRVFVRLTKAGERIRSAGSVLDPDLVAALLERLKPADRARAIEGLELLAKASSGMESALEKGTHRGE